MFAFVVFVLVFQYYAKRLAGKNVSKMTYFVSDGDKTLTCSINQSINHSMLLLLLDQTC